MQILGIGADGDSKFRRYFLDEFSKRHGMVDEVISVSHKGFSFVSVVKNVHGLRIPTVMFPDWKHLIKKWRNQILNVRRVLVLGDSFVMIEDLMRLYEANKLKSGLWKSDIFVRDKQNVAAALRILQPEVRECLSEWNKDRSQAIRVYLKVGHNMLRAYTDENLTVKERSKLAWSSVCFVRLWKAWCLRDTRLYCRENYFRSTSPINLLIPLQALADIRDGPDESDTITVEELLDVENDVLCSAAETNEHCYSFALSDLAASSIPRSNAFDREEGGEENGDVDDDDDPRHCHLFQKGTCKYANPAFKAPKTTHWIGCDYPGCDNWFHESCLNLKFSTDSERETYAFVCTSHGNVKGMEQYKDLVAATASDISMMEEDEQNEGTFHLKRRRRFNYGEKTSAASQCSVPPNYVEYDGEFYHIAEFLSLQQGKVYKPSTSRMARWMAVSRNDFYERVERLVAPTRSENGLYFEDIAAFWVPRLGMRCGLVLRLVRNTFSKSPVPVFEWKK
ncbi:unnamed protein product, partial [Porites lobata]